MDVGARPDRRGPSDGLLGGHVGQRSHDGPDFGLARALVKLGQAEVGNLGLAIGRQEDVCGFQVPVHDPSAVHVIDGPCQCFHQDGRRPRRLGQSSQRTRERPPLDIFECQVRLTVAFADLVDLHEVGMLAFRDRRRFAFEAGALLGIGLSSRVE